MKNARRSTQMNAKSALSVLAALIFLALIVFAGTTTVMAADDVCQIGTQGYTTLDDAVTAANSSDSDVTIKLQKDVTISSDLTINNTKSKAITITSADKNSPNTLTFNADASFDVSTDFTLDTLVLDGKSEARTKSAFTITGGTTTVMSNISNFGSKKATATCAGGVFNVSGDSTILNLKSGDISSCTVASDANEEGYEANNGGSVLYLNGGTVNLSGMYIYYCGSGEQEAAPSYICAGPVCVKSGTFNMTGGSINNNNGGCGGAISLWSGATANVSGGSILSNQASIDGGAVYAASGSTLNISGSVWIKDNVSSSGGSAIAYRSGATVNIDGAPMITGNHTDDTNAEKNAAIFSADANATITISGSPTIRYNTRGQVGPQANLMVNSITTLKVGNMSGAPATVGICSPKPELLKIGNQFATASSGAASTTKNLQTFFCDNNPTDDHEALVGSAGDGSAIVWKSTPYVCKIVTNGVTTPYLTLQDALDSVPNPEEDEVAATTTIEMLAGNYEIKNEQDVGSNEGARNITITTASVNATDGYPYTGTSGTNATLTRTTSCTALNVLEGTTLTLTNITLKDTEQRGSSCSLIKAVAAFDKITLNLKDGTVVTGGSNGSYDSKGAGVYLEYTTLNMTGNATISDCNGAIGSAIYAVYSTVGMSDTSSITGCTSYKLGAVTLATNDFFGNNNSKLTMSGNSKITDNTGTGTSAKASAVYFSGDSAQHEFTMKDNAEISANTIDTARTDDPYYAATVSAGSKAVDITMSGNAVIKDNVVKNPDKQSAGGIALSAGCTLTMSENAAITGNKTQSASGNDTTSTSGGVNVLTGKNYADGKVTISDNINITGNTCRNGAQKADVTVVNAAMLNVKNLEADASVGVYSATDNLLNNGVQFATAESGTASSTENLEALFNDKNPVDNTTLVGISGTDSAIIWGEQPYVCKIGQTLYSSLQNAIDAVSTDGTAATIEMLSAKTDITAVNTIGSDTAKKNITITTAKKDDVDGYPYRGASGTYAILKRTGDCTAFSVAAGSSLTLTNIILKDTAERAAISKNAYNLIKAVGTSNADATVNLGSGTVVTGGSNGSSVNSKGAGIYLKYAVLNMSGDAKISECAGADGSAVYADSDSTVTLEYKASITDNTSTAGGAVDITSGCSLYMSDAAAVTGNKNTDANSTSSGVNAQKGSKVTLSGSVNITGNTCKNGAQAADLTLPDNTDTLVVGSAGLTDGASVGIYSAGGSLDAILQNGAKFASVTDDFATKTVNLNVFFNNATGLFGAAGIGKMAVWGNGELTVSKTTSGDGADTTKQFSFTLKGLQDDGLTYTGYIYKASDPDKSLRSYSLSSSSQDFSLANGEFMKITGLPVGSSLTVTESDTEVTAGSNSVYKGSIENGEVSTTTFSVSDLTATAPTGGLSYGASSLNVSNARNSVALTPGSDSDKTGVYKDTTPKNFSITGVDSAYKAVWCNSDGTTTDTPKSAGTLKTGAVNQGQSSLTLTPSAEAGTYYFKVTDGSISSNVITYTITQIPVTITGLMASDKVYDGSADAYVTGTPSLNGILSGDKVSVTNGSASFANKNAGTNKTVSYTGYSLAGTDAANYILAAQPASVTASISTVPVTVTPKSGQYKKINTADPAFTYTSSGAVGKEVLSFTGALDRDAGETVGDYSILIGSLALTDNGSFTAANYTLQFTNGVTFEIGKGDVPESQLFADFGIIKKDADTQSPLQITFTLSGTGCKNSVINISATTDASGQATFSDVPVGLLSDGIRQPYTLTETAPDGYATSGPWDVLSDTDQDGKEVISIKLHTAPDTDYQVITGKTGSDGYTISNRQNTLTVKKIDNQANSLTGATLKIEGVFADGSTEKSISNNEANTLKGVFISGNKYTLTETSHPEGYEGFYDKIIFHLDDTGTVSIDSNPNLSDQKAAAVISPDDGTVISLRNLPYTGSVTLTKKDFEDNAVLLKGVHYFLYKEKISGTQDVSKDTKIMVNGSSDFVTDSNGQIMIKDLSEGTYYFVEQSTCAGYELNSEVQKPFAIADTDSAHNHAVSVTYTNRKLMDITITANWSDADNAYGIRPDGITLTLYADGVKVDPQPASLTSPAISGNTWTYTLTGLKKYKTGTGDLIAYTVKEESIAHYKASSDTAVVKDGAVAFTNTLSLDTATATITDHSGSLSGATLSGAEYILVRKNTDGTLSYFTGNDSATGLALWSSKKEEAKKLTVGTDGTASVSGLYTGSYYFLQTKAPSGYKINSTPVTFAVTSAGSKTLTTAQTNKKNTSSSTGSSTGSSGSSKKTATSTASGASGSTAKGAKTGDSSGILLWVLIMLAALAAGGYAVYGRRKNKSNRR